MKRVSNVVSCLGACVVLLAIAAGCTDDGSAPVPPAGGSGGKWWQVGYNDGFQAGYRQCLHDLQNRRSEVISTMRRDITGHLILTSLLAVGGIVFGPSIMEKLRDKMVRFFNIPLPRQVQLAQVLFWSAVLLAVAASVLNSELRLVAPAVWILLGGALLVFLKELLPAVEGDRRADRKASVGKIKACFFLIFVFYILLRILSERGFLILRAGP